MNRLPPKKIVWIMASIGVVALSVSVGYQWAKHTLQNRPSEKSAAPASNERTVLYWYDPMLPGQHFDKPGKSPFMDMDLQPKYADTNASDTAGIRVDSRTQQNLGVRLAEVARQAFATRIDTVGTVAFNQRELAVVQARTNGFVSRVYARAPGDVIARGEPLVDLLVPEWAGAQLEFIALCASKDTDLIDAARERLRLLGMPELLIKKIEMSGTPQTHITIESPQAGVIQVLNARTGVTVSKGMTLAEINGIDSVWLNAAVPEALAQQVRVGDTLAANFPALADQIIHGKVIAILPEANADSRTLTVRVELPNTDGHLRPGQFARIALQSDQNSKVLSIPSEAVIRSDTRSMVIVANDDRFNPVEVETGRETGGRTEILSGLQEGERVVTSGQFLIDSEANLMGALNRMTGDMEQTPSTPSTGVQP